MLKILCLGGVTLILAIFAIATTNVTAHAGPAPKAGSHVEHGKASWYGPGLHGQPTASGTPFDSQALVAAHRDLPFGARVRVTNLTNGRQVTVAVVDRGPYRGGRIIDVSQAAARELGMLRAGVVPVLIEAILPGVAATRDD